MKWTLAPPLVALALAVSVGCSGSRWAKGDPVYAQKYPRHTSDPVKTVKQAVDARHLAGRDGFYSGGAVGSDTPVGEANAGYFMYPPTMRGMVEGRIGVKGLTALDSDGGVSGGLELGGRLQSPSRLAPFVGLAAYLGTTSFEVYEESSSRSTTTVSVGRSGAAVSLTPEAGVHFWLTPRWRLTASVAQNYVAFTDADHSLSYPTVGLTLSNLRIPYYLNDDERRQAIASFAAPEQHENPAQHETITAAVPLAGPVMCSQPIGAPPTDAEPLPAPSTNPYSDLLAPESQAP